jgi:hypothetical protein
MVVVYMFCDIAFLEQWPCPVDFEFASQQHVVVWVDVTIVVGAAVASLVFVQACRWEVISFVPFCVCSLSL